MAGGTGCSTKQFSLLPLSQHSSRRRHWRSTCRSRRRRARLWSVATNWTGCYVNGGVGYDLSNRDHFSFNETGFVNRDGTSGARGYLGRVGGGCDYQFSPAGGWATGSSARSPDYDLMNLHGGFTDAATLVTAPSRENWAAAAGGRIGVLVTSQVLTYVNGGWTSTRFSGVDFPRGADHLANTDF